MDRAIGVFDSGVGGLSVLAEARALLPAEDFVYYGDNGNAPYGEKSEGEIVALTLAAVNVLLGENIKALVIACNTATSAAASILRQRLDIPVIGMEPALKPAQELRHGGRILVMATPATLRLPKFDALMSLYGEGAVPVPVSGLVELIQSAETTPEEIERLVGRILEPYRREHIDAIVLGCTHYLFVRDLIAKVAGPEVKLVDGNLGTARQLKRLLENRGLLRVAGEGCVKMMTSGEKGRYLPLMERLLRGT